MREYVIQHQLGKGSGGGVVYRALHVDDTEREPVALKYPAREHEQEVLRAIHDELAEPPGILPLLDWGPQYIVTEILGPPLSVVFEALLAQSFDSRWDSLCLIGRLLLQSLEAMHKCGVVHNDVQPGNVLLGRCGKEYNFAARTFFIDFGNARYLREEESMPGEWGSVDFNSVKSGDGGIRGPYDDLESLGWMLCHGLFGELPWFDWTRLAWETDWREHRAQVCKKVQRAKASVFVKGWCAFGPSWKHLTQIPNELHEFLCTCHRRQGLPDYHALAALLRSGKNWHDFIRQDLRQFEKRVLPVVPAEDNDGLGMRKKDRTIIRVPGQGSPWQKKEVIREAVPASPDNAHSSRRDYSPETPRSSFVTFDFQELDDASDELRPPGSLEVVPPAS